MESEKGHSQNPGEDVVSRLFRRGARIVAKFQEFEMSNEKESNGIKWLLGVEEHVYSAARPFMALTRTPGSNAKSFSAGKTLNPKNL